MTRLPVSELRRISDHARRAYPYECCGALVGRARGAGEAGRGDGVEREVRRAVPLANDRTHERERRYIISAGAVLEVERDAARDGLEVVGFYHSHPDHPAEPSAFDLEHAWPWYTYLIVPVRAGAPGAPRGWRLAEDRGGFHEDGVTILEEDQ
jgi:proteasome lid subunit RPN8/RPN11